MIQWLVVPLCSLVLQSLLKDQQVLLIHTLAHQELNVSEDLHFLESAFEFRPIYEFVPIQRLYAVLDETSTCQGQ